MFLCDNRTPVFTVDCIKVVLICCKSITCDYMWSTFYEAYSAITKLQHYRKTVSVLVQLSYHGTWKLDPVPLAVVTSANSEPVALLNCSFPPSIISISRSLFDNSRAFAKNLSSVVFLVRLSRQFGLTGQKAAWRCEISSRYTILTTSLYNLSGRCTSFYPKREPFPFDGEGFIIQ